MKPFASIQMLDRGSGIELLSDEGRSYRTNTVRSKSESIRRGLTSFHLPI